MKLKYGRENNVDKNKVISRPKLLIKLLSKH